MKIKNTVLIAAGSMIAVSIVAAVLLVNPFLKKAKTTFDVISLKPENIDRIVMSTDNTDKKCFEVKNTEDVQEWGRQMAVDLYKKNFFKDAESEFPKNTYFKEIENKMITDIYGRDLRVSICFIIPDGFVSEKSGEYEIDGTVLNIDSFSTPSPTGLYAIIDDSQILTLDDAVYSRKYSINMNDIYYELPQEYRNLEYINLSSSEQKELEQKARTLIKNNLEAFSKIFILGMLPADVPEGTEVIIRGDESVLYPVKSDKYKTLSDLENFLRKTYIKRTADRLMYNTFGRGPMYVEKDGKFCIDLSKEVGLGYSTGWNNYRIKLSDTTRNSAKLTVTVSEFAPDDEYEHDRDVVFTMIKQDDNWLFADMKY